jgi:hypothetical protein
MQTRWRDLRMLAVAVMVVPLIAAADGADELALTIEQNLASIQFRLDLRPYQAGQDLEEQGRQIELLAKEAPDHAALRGLEERYQTLQADVADALARAESGDAAAQIPGAPAGFAEGLEEVAALQRQAEAEMYGGDPGKALGYLEQSEAQIAALEERYRSEIPAGHVPLLVAKEKAAALKDQLADRDAP